MSFTLGNDEFLRLLSGGEAFLLAILTPVRLDLFDEQHPERAEILHLGCVATGLLDLDESLSFLQCVESFCRASTNASGTAFAHGHLVWAIAQNNAVVHADVSQDVLLIPVN